MLYVANDKHPVSAWGSRGVAPLTLQGKWRYNKDIRLQWQQFRKAAERSHFIDMGSADHPGLLWIGLMFACWK